MSINTASIVDAIRQVIGSDAQEYPLHEPLFGTKEREYVDDCLNSTFVSSVGPYVGRFEEMLAQYTDVKRAIAVVNGTAALQVALKLVGVEPNEEVLLPAFTFVATANAVAHCGAIPHFVDSDLTTLGLDAVKLADYLTKTADIRVDGSYNKLTGRRIRAVVPMHTFGHPVEIDRLLEVCDHFRLELVEDAAESLGSLYKGKHTGKFGRVSALSFNGNKIVTTGGGGAILTDDDELADRAKHLTTTAKVPHQWEYYHDEVGFNYRMPNLNAALGCAQLENIESFIDRKRHLAKKYLVSFSNIEGVFPFVEPSFARSNYWLNAIILNEPSYDMRNLILEATHKVGIKTRPAWTLLHRLPMYRESPRMNLPVAERIEASLVNLPSSVGLS